MAAHCGPNNYQITQEGEEAIGTDTFVARGHVVGLRDVAQRPSLEHATRPRPVSRARAPPPRGASTTRAMALVGPPPPARWSGPRPGRWRSPAPAATEAAPMRCSDVTETASDSPLFAFRRGAYARSLASSSDASSDQVDAVQREPPRRRRGARTVSVVEAPLRVTDEQRELEAAAERQREPARAGLEPIGLRHRLADPRGGVLERRARDLDRAREAGIRRGARRCARSRRSSASSAPPLPSARSVSSDSTFVVPSQIGSTCASARRRGRPGVLDVAGAAARLDRLGRDGDRLLAGGELRDRDERARQPLVELASRRSPCSSAPSSSTRAEREAERARVLGLEPGERVDVERLVDEQRAEHLAAARVVTGERERAAHPADRADRVPRARDARASA